MTVWLNGRFVDADAALSTRDRSFLIGDGVFETLLMRDGAPVLLDAHLARLSLGLATMRIAVPPALTSIRPALAELSIRNACAAGAAAARITVSRGEGGRGLDVDCAALPTLLVSVEPYAPPKTAAVVVLTRRRILSAASTRRFKATGGYVENLLARLDAREAGADEGLLCNENGVVIGASAASLFALTAAGVLRTPAIEEGALDGVVRRIVLEEARAMALPVEEGGLTPADLDSADLFLTNSLIGVRSARLPGATSTRPQAVAALETRYKAVVESQGKAGGR